MPVPHIVTAKEERLARVKTLRGLLPERGHNDCIDQLIDVIDAMLDLLEEQEAADIAMLEDAS